MILESARAPMWADVLLHAQVTKNNIRLKYQLERELRIKTEILKRYISKHVEAANFEIEQQDYDATVSFKDEGSPILLTDSN